MSDDDDVWRKLQALESRMRLCEAKAELNQRAFDLLEPKADNIAATVRTLLDMLTHSLAQYTHASDHHLQTTTHHQRQLERYAAEIGDLSRRLLALESEKENDHERSA